jgi:hypothetical protein
MLSSNGLRRAGEHHFSIAADEQEANQYVGRHGLEAFAKNYVRLAVALNINAIDLLASITGITLDSPEEPANSQPQESEAQPSPEPQFYNRRGAPITEARHKGGKRAWETRRAIDEMVAANPRLNRLVALALYRDEHPRSRAKNLPGPRNNPTKGESSWDTRLRNIIKKHHKKTGKILSWQEAHQIALDSLQGSRAAA